MEENRTVENKKNNETSIKKPNLKSKTFIVAAAILGLIIILLVVFLIVMPMIGNGAKVKEVEKSIAAIDKVSLENRAAVDEARIAFDDLDQNLQDKVKNKSLLDDSVKELKELERIEDIRIARKEFLDEKCNEYPKNNWKSAKYTDNEHSVTMHVYSKYSDAELIDRKQSIAYANELAELLGSPVRIVYHNKGGGVFDTVKGDYKKTKGSGDDKSKEAFQKAHPYSL